MLVIFHVFFPCLPKEYANPFRHTIRYILEMEEGLSNFPKMILKSQDSNLGSLALEDKINTIRYFCTGIMSTVLV